MATATPPEKGKVQYTRPVVDAGTVYVGRQILVGTNQRLPDVQHVQAFDAACGDPLWRAPVAGNPGGLMVTDETVFVHDDATLYALDAATGQRRWTHEPSDAIAHAVATDDGVLLTSVSDGSSEELRAVRPDGSVGWRLSVPATVVGDLAWVDGRAYLVTDDAVLLAVDTGSRSVAWSLDLQDGEDTVPGRVAATPEVVVAVVDGVVYAVTSGGAREWSTDVGVRDLATDGDAVYGVDLDGYARALSVDDGAEQWRRFHGRENPRLVDGFYGTPALGEGTLYAGTLDGTLLAMAAGDGAERWRLHHDWEGDATVALAEETLVVAWGNHLLALR
jgi:outer membrane protein assembly factor BamB